MKVFGISGWKNSGKTSLVERLVSEFAQRGLKVSTIKHAHHDFDVDHEGRDSYRHRAAGASEVLVASAKRWALMSELRNEAEPSLLDLLNKLSPCDLVLVEGFKREPMDRIECYRSEVDNAPLARFDDRVLALAVDAPVEDVRQPQFALEDTKSIADFISRHLEL
ncbi:MAG: molybdopterin-guanine dinucleotide biosynthesis protein B [Pseudomonadota bacterium]